MNRVLVAFVVLMVGLAAFALPERNAEADIEIECPVGAPEISTSDGAVTCCAITQRRLSQNVAAWHTWQCPPGWRVTVPPYDPGVRRVVEWVP